MSTATTTERVKILFALPRDTGRKPPAACEALWGHPLEGSDFELDSPPFFAPGLACGDVVTARQEEGEWHFVKRAEAGGHGTIRVVLADAKAVPAVRKLVDRCGCASELGERPGLLAVDVPPDANVDRLLEYLNDEEAAEHLAFDVVCADW